MANDKNFEQLKKLSDLIMTIQIIDSQKVVKQYCGCGKDMIALSSDGHFYPCPSFLGNDIFKIKKNKVGRPAVANIMDCEDCIAYSTCHGYCYYSRYIASRSKQGYMEAMCVINRFITKLALTTYAQLYLI